jgi:hypothetical protein
MQRRDFLKTGAAATVLPLLMRARAQSLASSDWVSLLNFRDLTGWYSMLQRSGRGVAEKRGMVTFEDGMLHILGNLVTDESSESGYLATEREYENVHIRAEYKWGVKRFPPRTATKRDNGILYGLVGADKVWPAMIECQIEEGDVGDAFMSAGTRSVQNTHGNGLFAGAPGYDGWPAAMPGRGGARRGPAPEPTSARKIKDGDFERPNDWNTVEVMWKGDRAAHLVNGRVVNVLSQLQQPDPEHAGQYLPLTRGKLAIELEFAEIWYRRFEVRSLT